MSSLTNSLQAIPSQLVTGTTPVTQPTTKVATLMGRYGSNISQTHSMSHLRTSRFLGVRFYNNHPLATVHVTISNFKQLQGSRRLWCDNWPSRSFRFRSTQYIPRRFDSFVSKAGEPVVRYQHWLKWSSELDDSTYTFKLRAHHLSHSITAMLLLIL